MQKKSRLILILFLFLVFIKFPSAIKAETVNINQEVNGSVKLPDEEVTLHGSGEKGSIISITAFKGNIAIYTTETTVDSTGQWQVKLPKFSEGFPDKVVVHTEVKLTTEKIVEVTAITSAVAVSNIVLLQLFAERGFRLFQLIGLIRKRKTKGFVFDVLTNKPIAFALLTIQRLNESGKVTMKETVVTNVQGFFQTISLPNGKYIISAAHPDYLFPSKGIKPAYATPLDFYQGEVLEFTSQEKLEICFIPMSPKGSKSTLKINLFNPRVVLQFLTEISKAITIPMAIISLIVLWFYPSFINFLIFSLYLVLFFVFLYQKYRNNLLKGKVLLKNGEAVANAVVRIFSPKKGELISILSTNKHGVFQTRLPKGDYQVLVSKEGFFADPENGMSIEVVDLRRNQTKLSYKLISV